jgi:hypothetical protein
LDRKRGQKGPVALYAWSLQGVSRLPQGSSARQRAGIDSAIVTPRETRVWRRARGGDGNERLGHTESGLLLGLLIALPQGVFGLQPSAVAAQGDADYLAVRVAMCPDDYDGADFYTDCFHRLATVFWSSTLDLANRDNPEFTETRADGARLLDLTPTSRSLRVVVTVEGTQGELATFCSMGGRPIDLHWPETASTSALFEIYALEPGDIECDVFVPGNQYAEVYAGVVDVSAVDPASEDEVVALPNTGSGPGGAPAAELTWLTFAGLLPGLACAAVEAGRCRQRA